MASTLCSCCISKLLVVFALLHLVQVHEQPSWFVKGDVIVDECNKTLYPSVCLGCLKVDHSRKSDSREELVHAVILCAENQAVNAHNDAASLVQNTTGPANLKAAFQFCEKSLLSAQNYLVQAQHQVEGRDFKNAWTTFGNARKGVFDCENNLLPILRTISVSKKLLDDMQATVRLNDVAQQILSSWTLFIVT
ncbi:hypothetical protein FRX31_026450 [Thalictrum thalictroides]|uniref:Pectinesterase inhibitor domain-containing protein n=1 Tax=Thalictrum thalictroides TaxID=46969 RepID=A0A7J6VFS8_THATH|nr:hypothetical protein FRX31_026450 [Thalictrum thalictroides]